VETAALKKAGDNRNTLFDRKLTQLYTPSTWETFMSEMASSWRGCSFVDDLDSQDDFGQATPPLMSIVEELRGGGSGPDDKVVIGFISIVPSTGDLVYDEFEGVSNPTLERPLP
jgi:DNA mismatch repair protein MSH3